MKEIDKNRSLRSRVPAVLQQNISGRAVIVKRIKSQAPILLNRRKNILINQREKTVPRLDQVLDIENYIVVEAPLEEVYEEEIDGNFEEIQGYEFIQTQDSEDPEDTEDPEYLEDAENPANTKDNIICEYVCDSCDESFDTSNFLIVHKTERSIVKTRAALRDKEKKSKPSEKSCDTCDESFATNAALIVHKTEQSIIKTRAALRDKTKPKPSKKSPNESFFDQKSRIERKAYKPKVEPKFHKIVAKPMEEVSIESANDPQEESEYENQTSGSTKKMMQEIGPVECKVCLKTFKKQKYLNVHEAIHNSPYICHICGKSTTSSYYLNMHIRRHNKEFSFFCEVCQKGFYLKANLKLHMTVHSERKPCFCKVCNKPFANSLYLKNHMKLHEEPSTRKKFKCDLCPFETFYSYCIKEHRWIHTGEGQVSCEFCGKMVRKQYMKTHIRIHTGEKPEMCEFCGKAFSAKKYLIKHRRTHTGEKPYQCNICEKRFTQRGTLTAHLRRHELKKEGTKRKRGRPIGEKKARRGRFKKQSSQTGNGVQSTGKTEFIDNRELETQVETVDERPRKIKNQESEELNKRKRGRPPKNPPIATDCIAKRTRGRPRKSSPFREVKLNPVAKIDESKAEKTPKMVKALRNFEEGDSTSEGPSDDNDSDFLPSLPTEKSLKKTQYRCRFCNFRTYYKNNYLNHMERYDETPGSFDCHLCDESLPLRRELDAHWRNHMPSYFPDGPEKPGFYECDMCDEKFLKKFQLGRHRQAHRLNIVPEPVPRKMKRCRVCGKRFYSEVALFKHMEQATDEHEPVECDVCKKVFRSKRNLIMHLRIHIGPLICHICGSRKYSDASMKVHIRRHNKDYYIHCDVCNKGFYNKSELRLHMISHTNRETNRPFVCQICGRSYRSGCYLKLHVKIAHVEAEEYKRKRYKCDICDFETHLLKCLKIHKQTHTGENLIACELCNKMINRRYMPIHIRTHTGEKPFDCSICGKGFNCKKNLVRHHSRKHQAKV